jgi:hypothetical protein
MNTVLNDLHDSHGVNFDEVLKHSSLRAMRHAKDSTIGIIPAHRSGGERTKERTALANCELKDDFRKSRYDYTHIQRIEQGHGSPSSERSFLVIERQSDDKRRLKKTLTRLGRKYERHIMHNRHIKRNTTFVNTALEEYAWE